MPFSSQLAAEACVADAASKTASMRQRKNWVKADMILLPDPAFESSTAFSRSSPARHTGFAAILRLASHQERPGPGPEQRRQPCPHAEYADQARS